MANGDAAKPLEDDGSKEDGAATPSSPDRAGDVRLWVLEISPSGLTDTPRAHTVRANAGTPRLRWP